MTYGPVGLAIDADGVARSDATSTFAVAPLLAVVGPGAVGVGAEAAYLAAGGAVTYSDFTDRVGDPVPVVGSDGRGVAGAELTAAVIGRLLGDRPRDATVIAHSATWGEYEHAALRSGLARWQVSMARTSMVPRPVIAATHALANGRIPCDTVMVADIGSRGMELAIVADIAAGSGRVVDVSSSDEFGASDLDHAVLQYVIDQLGIPLARLDLGEVVTRAQAARRALHRRPVAVVEVAGCVAYVVRTDVELVVGAAVSRAADAIATAAAARGPAVSAVVLVGEAATTPLLTKSLSQRLSVPVVVPPQPEYAVVAGAARTAALSAMQAGRQDLLPPSSPQRWNPTPPAATAAFVRGALRTPARRSRGLFASTTGCHGGGQTAH
jgi:hypothetical protein